TSSTATAAPSAGATRRHATVIDRNHLERRSVMKSIGRIVSLQIAAVLLLGGFHAAEARDRHAAGGITARGLDAARDRHAAGGITATGLGAARDRHAAGGITASGVDAARDRHAAGGVTTARASGERAQASSHAVDLNQPFTR